MARGRKFLINLLTESLPSSYQITYLYFYIFFILCQVKVGSLLLPQIKAFSYATFKEISQYLLTYLMSLCAYCSCLFYIWTFLCCFSIMFCCVFSSGIENNPTVFYRLMPGSTAQTNKFHTFYLQQRADNGFTWADIKVNHPLDYESIKEYNLTIRVEVSRY